MLVDSHCHLHPGYFPDGPGAVMERARGAGVTGFVVIGGGTTAAPAHDAIALARRESAAVAAVVGVHPHDAAHVTVELFEEYEALARAPEVVAVGEVGLDYHYDHSPRDVQRGVFARFIALARELKKPVVVHTRSAAEDTLDLLVAEGAREVGGIIHCFSEDRAFAKKVLDLDFDLSFSGILTFKTAEAIRDAAAFAPADRIHVETDSPYLAPIPFRGKPCEPAYVVHTARRLAEVRGVPLADLIVMTHDNSERRFRRGFPRDGSP